MSTTPQERAPDFERKDFLLLVVDDRADNREAIAEAFERQGYTVMVASGGREAIAKAADHHPDLVITDLKMPDMDGLEVLKTLRAAPTPPEVILLTAYGTVETAVDALKQGAFNYLTKPVNLRDLRAQAERALEMRLMRRDARRWQQRAEMDRMPTLPKGVICESPPMKQLMEMVRQVGPTQSSVLVLGESGVGKEIVAQAIHRFGGDESRPFVAVHCAALPDSLLESELFGYERGAFTGADRQHIGRLELADGGTLFLDEVGEIPPSMQVKLLRVLEERELVRLGGRQIIKVQFRLVAATNRNLEEEVRSGRFREDLYYRLNVVRLSVPPLRERPDDILPLAELFMRQFAAEQGTAPPRLTREARTRLRTHNWPGNVRELRNLAERLTIFCPGQEVEAHQVPIESVNLSATAADSPTPSASLDLQALEKQAILQALERFGGNRSTAAQALGISRRTLQRKLKDYRLSEGEHGEGEDDTDSPGGATS